MFAGTFPDGPDLILTNPEFSARRWRHERLWAALAPRTVLTGLAGAVLAVLAISATTGMAAVAALGAGALVIALSVLLGWANATDAITEHQHAPGRRCRLDRVRGEFFFRSRAFADLGTASTVVRTLIAGVDELHRSPARDWLDPALPGEVHRVVWQALCCLDRTRSARALATDLAADPDTAVGELAAAAHRAVTVIDNGLHEVAGHLHGCLVLTRAWETKLRHAELAARADHTLAALPSHDYVRQLAEAAHALPQTVFASITAARDITGAGDFPWEQPRPRARLRYFWRRYRPRRGAVTATGVADTSRALP